MPSTSMFYGLIVYMYFRDKRQHELPHIHVRHQDFEVIVSIPNGNVLEGRIRSRENLLALRAKLDRGWALIPVTGCSGFLFSRYVKKLLQA
uniref:DUF4160 domain-containing protein n=1 Tax=Candidatus Kentrum sp. SD TaxID=2126332 RepID=A0A450YQ60_9GAMM|nr:MAG: protein of unknown function (DUF4160) [Candidatus Kentron sp. SD]VFK43701.1 MAG: protein of unknown function (DUF4160) [Candidatus Kentron sp. SD]